MNSGKPPKSTLKKGLSRCLFTDAETEAHTCLRPLGADGQVRPVGSLCSTWHLLLREPGALYASSHLAPTPALPLGVYCPNVADKSRAQRGLLCSLESHSQQVTEPVIGWRRHRCFLLPTPALWPASDLGVSSSNSQGSVSPGCGFPCH